MENNSATLPVEYWEKFVKDAKWSADYHTEKLREAQAQLQAGEMILATLRASTPAA